MKNAIPELRGYQDDDFEYALALMRGKPIVYRQRASSSIHDSLLKEMGELKTNEVNLAVKQYPGRTVYEMAFAKCAVSPFLLKAGESMRWNIIVNLNNGEGRMGWLELTPGIGKTKMPSQFIDMVLLK